MFGGFGQTPTTTTTSSTFTLGGSNTSAGGGFAFGQTTAAPTTTAAAAPGFNFGAATSKAPTGGFGGFNFAASSAAPTAAPTAPATASTGFNFSTPASGATTTAGGFGFGGPAQTTTSSGGGFTLGGAPTSAASVAPTLGGTGAPQASTGGFSLGGSSTGSLSSVSTSGGTTGFSLAGVTPATSSQPSTLGLGGSIFGAKTATVTATKPAAAGFAGFGTPSTAAPTSSASLLGGLLTSSASKPATTSATATSLSAGFAGFGTATTSSAAPTSSAGGFGNLGLSGFPSNTTTATSAVTSTATSATSAAPGKQMTFRQLEETINKWTTELEEQERNFLDQATQVNAWDRIVMDNGDRIIELNQAVEKVKLDQQKLDHELDFVHSQQRELEDLISPLESALGSLPPVSYTQHADVEREHTYVMAESLDAQLKRMGQDLKEIIERLNATNSKPDNNDPLQQVTKILNAHVTSLMWVDRNTVNLQKRVEDISKQMNVEKREQERNFRLAYS